MLRQLAIFTLWRTSRKEKWRESAVSERVWINHKFQVTHTFTYTFMHTTNTHTVLVCECRLSPRARWLTVLFFRSSERRLWADAITSVPSTCQVPLLALTVAWRGQAAGRGGGGGHWTQFWTLSLPLCARSASQFISQPPLSSAVLSQASQQVSLCRRILPQHKAAALCARTQNGKQWSPPYN